MKISFKVLYINLISTISIFLIIELLSGYFLQYRYSYNGLQIVELINKSKFKLFRETRNKLFLEKPKEKFAKLIKFRKSNITNIFPTYIYDPQLHEPGGYFWLTNPKNTKVLFCKEKSGLIEFDTNRFGLRSINEKDEQSNFEFIFFGDSLVDGACVNNKNTIPQHFSFLNSKKVLNAGRSHSGPLFQLALLTELLKYDNEIERIISDNATIIWILFPGNDLYNLVEEKTSLLANYLGEGYSQNYFKNLDKISSSQKLFLDEFIDIVDNYSDRSFTKFHYGESSKYEWMAKRNKNTLKEIMKVFKKRVEDRDLNLRIVSIMHKDPKNSIMKITQKLIDDNCESLNMDCLKIVAPSEEFNLKRSQMINLHFNEEGYKSIAEIINNNIDFNF